MKPVCRQERGEEAVKFYNYNFALISTHGASIVGNYQSLSSLNLNAAA